jgi:ankyrin repeat protein
VDAPLGAAKETALFASVRAGYIDLAATLLKAGANAKVKDDNGDAPLIHLAKYCDEVELVRAFIRLGADVNAATRAGWTPLKEAENQHCPAIAKELRKAGAKQ